MLTLFILHGPVDYLRVFILLACLTCLGMLIHRFVKGHKQWNVKTRNFWYALLAWSAAGVAVAIQGIIDHNPFTPRTLLVTIAAVVSLAGLLQSGDWGGEE